MKIIIAALTASTIAIGTSFAISNSLKIQNNCDNAKQSSITICWFGQPIGGTDQPIKYKDHGIATWTTIIDGSPVDISVAQGKCQNQTVIGAVKGDTIRIENDDSGQCKATKL